ncbi:MULTISPECIES: hypothetical protein [Bacillus]|uniref:hypothetical protein n=1 Tax=Bacillus TaxID=1386 RepID=UPI00032FFFF5|nr:MULTISPECIES: hypothetical protein [Bacillus cereus group]EOP49947.1 hypothetical protein IIW_03356 [Bacillus cereus VD136]EOP65722.1 hypothetical protein KOW_02085 [Bacillus cereus VDM006]OOG92508.1 hypothetical protein BTH41_05011 [Bacillus mycoides]MDF2084503.1 hypothetical protein [Bacillus pseudomycoides]PEL31271.1 hypothetical protein CN608_06920 [Bacillus pseudomycoides]
MKNNSTQQTASYITILLLGTVFFYFDAGLEVSLMYAVGFIIFSSVFGLLRKLFFKKNTGAGEYPLPEMDERIEKLSLKLYAQIFGLSHLIGAVILFVLYITNKNTMIRVEYVLYYVIGVLFFTMMFGLKIVKKLDQ